MQSIQSPRRLTKVADAFVTGNAAAALDANGKFRLQVLLPAEQINGSQASALALALVNTYRGNLQDWMTRRRGAAVDLRRLSACGDQYLALPQHNAPPPNASVQVQKILGAKWMVQLCQASSPVALFSVSALANDIGVEGGRLTGQPVQDFNVVVFPLSADGVVTPENAVTAAATATGARVAEVPELVLPARPLAPGWAAWHLVLDRDVSVRGLHSHQIAQVRDLYVGPSSDLRTLVLEAPDPTAKPRLTMHDLSPTRHALGAEISLALIPGRPGTLEAVEVVQ